MPSILFDPTSAGLERALDIRNRNHGLLTSNIANANTPGYKAQRLDFKASFDRAFEQVSEAMEMGAPAPPSSVDDFLEISEEPAPPGRVDGNSVRREVEMGNLALNSIAYETTVEMMNRRFAMLEYAASDGGR